MIMIMQASCTARSSEGVCALEAGKAAPHLNASTVARPTTYVYALQVLAGKDYSLLRMLGSCQLLLVI